MCYDPSLRSTQSHGPESAVFTLPDGLSETRADCVYGLYLFGNLLFFFVFAVLIGVATVVASLGYSYAMLGVPGALPTVGMSGVVMAAVAALGVMMPRAKIRCFFWLLLIFRVIRLPAWLLAFWYIGWDLYDMNGQGDVSYLNYAAHVSGAVLGVLFGVVCLLFAKESIERAAEEYSDGEHLPLTTLANPLMATINRFSGP